MPVYFLLGDVSGFNVYNNNLYIIYEKVDKGEEILKSIVKDDILEIRDNEEKQD